MGETVAIWRVEEEWGPDWLWKAEALFQGIKRHWREADHSLSSAAEVKKSWIYKFIPPYVLMT
jgi:hypothetical protein